MDIVTLKKININNPVFKNIEKTEAIYLIVKFK